MTQNTSSAVMQQRKEPSDSFDYFPTPPWATRALCEKLFQFGPTSQMSVWEPACGEGHMSRSLGEYFASVYASDVQDFTATFPEQDDICDFLVSWDHPGDFHTNKPDWIITNPPFVHGADFIRQGMHCSKLGVAVLVRTSFLEGVSRAKDLFTQYRPALILQFAERVPMFKGRLDKEGSTATSYCWIVFTHRPVAITGFDWIMPCRQRLERPTDYPVSEDASDAMPLFDGGTS